MRRYFFILYAITLLLSCSKKDDSNNPKSYYFKFKANGILKQYFITGSFFYNETDCLLGGTADSITYNSIAIDLITDSKIKADTTYTETQKTPAPIPYYPKCYIRLADNFPYYNYSSWISTPAGPDIYDCTVTILELDTKHVKGRFSGKVSTETGSAFIIITDGEFNVKR